MESSEYCPLSVDYEGLTGHNPEHLDGRVSVELLSHMLLSKAYIAIWGQPEAFLRGHVAPWLYGKRDVTVESVSGI
jgi:hypothetical protein